MELLIKQRVFSWTDSYDVYDETGEARYSNPAHEMPGLLLVIAIDAANCDKN